MACKVLAPAPLPSWPLISTWILWTPPHGISHSYLLDHWPRELFLTLAPTHSKSLLNHSSLLENLLQTSPNWASLVTQLVKDPPAMWETWVWSLGWEDPLEKGMATRSRFLAWRIPWSHKESDTKEQLSLSLFKPLRLDCVPLPDPYFPSDTHRISCNCFFNFLIIENFNYRKFKCKKKRTFPSHNFNYQCTLIWFQLNSQLHPSSCVIVKQIIQIILLHLKMFYLSSAP